MIAHDETYCTLSQRDYAIELQKFSKTSKRKSKIDLKLRKLRVEAKKKHERLLEDKFFAHWPSFDCKSGFSLTESRYEK